MDKNLFHYTSRFHMLAIMKTGYLKLTESNLLKPISKEDSLPKPKELLYKPVVWLTRSATSQGNGLEGSSLNKSEIKITVINRDHYEPWVLWSRNNKINKGWAKQLERGNNPYSWYISESIIPLDVNELVKIENTITGEVILDTDTGIRTYETVVSKPVDIPVGSFKMLMPYLGLHEGESIKFTI